MFAGLFDEFFQVVIGEQRNVADSFSQWRLSQGDDVDPVVQVLAEFPFADGFFQIQICCQDHADIDLVSLVTANGFEFTVLQNSQQFDLQVGGSGTNFVQEDGSAIGLQELAHLVVGGTGERSGNMSEQFAFQQGIGQGPAGDFDKGLVSAVAHLMDGAGGHCLTGPGFTQDQDCGAGVSDTFDQVKHLEHAVIMPDDVAHAESLAQLSPQLFVFRDDLTLPEGTADRKVQFIINDWLGEVVERSQADRFDGTVDGSEARQQDDLCVGHGLRGPVE